MVEFIAHQLPQTVLKRIGTRRGLIEQRTPARYRERVGARHREIAARQMHFRQRLADGSAMRGIWLARPNPFEKIDDRRRSPHKRAKRFAAARLDRLWTDDAVVREMAHQAEEERQGGKGHRPFLTRGKERAGPGYEQ